MKRSWLILLVILVSYQASSQKILQISGRVTDGKEPLADVEISIKDSETAVFTDKQGRYSIQTSPRKTLVYSFLGMKTVDYLVEDISKVVNIEMYPEIEELDEVVVKRRRKTFKELEAEYDTNKNLIRTYFGILDKERASFSMTVVDGDDLDPAGIDFIGSLQSFVPAMRVSRLAGDPTTPVVFLPRRFNSLGNPRPVAYDVDGLLMTEPPTEILPANIKRIAVINSLAATARYGQLAAGGIIVINTRGGVFNPLGDSNQLKDQARIKNNVFNRRNLATFDRVPRQKDIETLYKLSSKKEADDFLQSQNLLNRVSVYNRMEIAEYYVKKWNDRERFAEIMKELASQNRQNPVILKSIAYHLEYYYAPEEAREVYKQIFKLRPGYAQSYRDLAYINANLEDINKSFDLLSRYINYRGLDELPIPAQGIDSIILAEYDQLLFKRGQQASGNPYLESKEAARLVFEWSHGDAEFEFQFVNPENRFFTWEHNKENDPALIRREKQLGYSSEQFFIGEGMPGKWQVNIKYQGNKSFDPTYLKLSVYHNYGTSYERKEIFLYKLTQKNVWYELFSFVNNPINTAP